MESGRGGRRAGAGRKAKRGEPTEPIITRLKGSNKTWLMAEAKRSGQSTGEVLDEAIEALMLAKQSTAPKTRRSDREPPLTHYVVIQQKHRPTHKVIWEVGTEEEAQTKAKALEPREDFRLFETALHQSEGSILLSVRHINCWFEWEKGDTPKSLIFKAFDGINEHLSVDDKRQKIMIFRITNWELPEGLGLEP